MQVHFESCFLLKSKCFPRELQAERQCSQNLQEKCKSLAAIQKKIEEESMSKKCQSISSLRDMMTAHKVFNAFQDLYISFTSDKIDWI